MDRRLIERTIEIANQSQGFGSRALRAALDSSPLWGAGRVEDTYNLVGHALKKVLRVVADQQERDLVEVARVGRSRADLCEQPEGGVGPRLGSTNPERRSIGDGFERITSRGNLGADPACFCQEKCGSSAK